MISPSRLQSPEVARRRHQGRIFGHPELTAFNASVTALFAKWKKANAPRLAAIAKSDHPKALIEALSEDPSAQAGDDAGVADREDPARMSRPSDRPSAKKRPYRRFEVPGQSCSRWESTTTMVTPQPDQSGLPNAGPHSQRVDRVDAGRAPRRKVGRKDTGPILELANAFIRRSTGETAGFTEPFIPRFPSAGILIEF